MSAPATRLDASLAALRAACEALPPHQPRAVACPIFGNAPPPPAPSTAGLPPLLAAASNELARALRQPPRLGDQWPFANPPRVQAWIDSERSPSGPAGGRPGQVKPHQVVQLLRFIRLGHSKRAAAERAKLKWSTALRILSGQCAIAHHPAVEAAGVVLPDWQPVPTGPKPAQNPAEARLSAERPAGGAGVATRTSGALAGPQSAEPQETDESGVPA